MDGVGGTPESGVPGAAMFEVPGVRVGNACDCRRFRVLESGVIESMTISICLDKFVGRSATWYILGCSLFAFEPDSGCFLEGALSLTAEESALTWVVELSPGSCFGTGEDRPLEGGFGSACAGYGTQGEGVM